MRGRGGVGVALLLLALGWAAVPMAEAAPTPEMFRQEGGEIRLDWARERFMATADGRPCSGRLDGSRSSLNVGGDDCVLRLRIVGGRARGTLEVRSNGGVYVIDAQMVPAHRAAPKPERQLTNVERRAQLTADRRASIERIKQRHRAARGS